MPALPGAGARAAARERDDDHDQHERGESHRDRPASGPWAGAGRPVGAALAFAGCSAATRRARRERLPVARSAPAKGPPAAAWRRAAGRRSCARPPGPSRCTCVIGRPAISSSYASTAGFSIPWRRSSSKLTSDPPAATQDLDQARLLLVEGPDEGQVLAEAAVGGRHCPTLIPLGPHLRKLRSRGGRDGSRRPRTAPAAVAPSGPVRRACSRTGRPAGTTSTDPREASSMPRAAPLITRRPTGAPRGEPTTIRSATGGVASTTSAPYSRASPEAVCWAASSSSTGSTAIVLIWAGGSTRSPAAAIATAVSPDLQQLLGGVRWLRVARRACGSRTRTRSAPRLRSRRAPAARLRWRR